MTKENVTLDFRLKAKKLKQTYLLEETKHVCWAKSIEKFVRL